MDHDHLTSDLERDADDPDALPDPEPLEAGIDDIPDVLPHGNPEG